MSSLEKKNIHKKKFSVAICGGTFDVFHSGHEKFLREASSTSNKLIIGITSDKYVWENKEVRAEPYITRRDKVKDFIRKNNINAELVEINDVYGPTFSKKLKIDAIFVTSDSKKGALEINRKRRKINLEPLAIVEIDILREKSGGVISSTKIREGKINRKGEPYWSSELIVNDLVLPKALRRQLQVPFGEVIENFEEWLNHYDPSIVKIVSVGDVVTTNFINKGIIPFLSIVDFVVQRKRMFRDISELGFSRKISFQKVVNPPGHLSRELIEAVQNSFREGDHVVILVNGEEDLAVIPTVLSAPLGCEVFYGQPNKGVVRIIITESIKEEIKDLISNFRQKVL